MGIRLRLITPTRTLVEAEVEQVTAPGIAGEFGVLPRHVAFVGALDDGILTYVERGASRRILLCGGYVEVFDDVVTVLADDAELPEEIDRATVKTELARIQRELATTASEPLQVASLLREQRRLEYRLALAH
jgi:F-type H+-transporting ATPase subunit epsilon